MIEQTPQEVARIVRDYVQNEHPGGVTLTVEEGGIRRDEFGWKVPLQISHEPRRMYEYYEALAHVEEDLGEKEGLKVLFVPLFADQTVAAP